jgi:hypothetical protein
MTAITPSRRHALRLGPALAALLLTAGLGGCALINTFHAEVASFGNWTAERKPGSYRFERLPSQATQPETQKSLEDAAAQALARAGFVPAAEGSEPDVLVQIGAKVSRQVRSPWDDPLWGRLTLGTRLGGQYPRLGWGVVAPWGQVEYEREVALLIRDRKSGEALYETRARSNGGTTGGSSVLQGMFLASLAEFPKVQNEPHNVAVTLP